MCPGALGVLADRTSITGSADDTPAVVIETRSPLP